MKTHHLLLALTFGVVGLADTQPWVVNSQPTQIAQAAQITKKAPTQTAQSVAAKVTVRIRVGQGFGSGVLLGKKGKTYLVLTNSHIVGEQADLNIQTFDGQSYPARRVKDLQVGKFDVALLEFTSDRAYQPANIDSSRENFALTEKPKLFAAGFARGANSLKVVTSEVKQLPQEPFVNGTQIGYRTTGDIEQGMSGGPILDEKGNLVGINSVYAYPIKPVYTYADGTKALPDQIAEYRQMNWGVPIYNLLTRLNPDILYGYKQLPKLHRTVTPSGYMAELDRKARSVTVRIEYSGGESSVENGSGVIVAKDGNSYYVLTSDHVAKNEELRVVTHDQRTYTINSNETKRSPETDLAVIKFTSTRPYQVATLGNYSVSDQALVFPGGWPAPKGIGSQQWQWQLNPGSISSREKALFKTQDKRSFRDGYDLIYSSVTYGGMSGGPVFDQVGQVIGIHGKAEGNTGTRNILGNSLGVSIKTFIGLKLNSYNLQIASTAPATLDSARLASVNLVRSNIAIPSNDGDAERWIEYGNQLHRLGKHADAVKAFGQAIKSNKLKLNLLGNAERWIKYGNQLARSGKNTEADKAFEQAIEFDKSKSSLLDAYHGEGLALAGKGDILLSLRAFNLAIELVPSGSKPRDFYYLWKYHALALHSLQRYSEALKTISTAISLEPNDNILVNEKALLLKELRRYPEAISEYDQMIKKEPKSAWIYYNRGLAKYDLGDRKEAINDFGLAIQFKPQDFTNYYSRATIRMEIGEFKEAISDFDFAIQIEPKNAIAYNNRAISKSQLKYYLESIADLNIAIKLNPQYAEAYSNRAISKSSLENRQGAITDFNIALQLFKSQNNQVAYDATINQIKKISN
jgi:tetratricopeptide (TPR) repeat protein/S1-C subfamily serine protease